MGTKYLKMVLCPLIGSRRGCWFVLVSAFVLIALSDSLTEGRMDCYICSWSARDLINGSTVQDTCTPTNFRPETVSVISCEGGCEAVAFKNTINGDVQHFHRNCAIIKEDSVLRDQCDETAGKFQFEKRCECFSSLCNGQAYTHSTVHLTVTILLSLLLAVVVVL